MTKILLCQSNILTNMLRDLNYLNYMHESTALTGYAYKSFNFYGDISFDIVKTYYPKQQIQFNDRSANELNILHLF